MSARQSSTLTGADFLPHLGSRFRLRAGSRPTIELELLDLSQLGEPGPAPGMRAPFSLVFRGPRRQALPQGLHALEHDQLGELAIFLVPLGPDEHGLRYEAVFG